MALFVNLCNKAQIAYQNLVRLVSSLEPSYTHLQYLTGPSYAPSRLSEPYNKISLEAHTTVYLDSIISQKEYRPSTDQGIRIPLRINPKEFHFMSQMSSSQVKHLWNDQDTTTSIHESMDALQAKMHALEASSMTLLQLIKSNPSVTQSQIAQIYIQTAQAIEAWASLEEIQLSVSIASRTSPLQYELGDVE